MLNQLAELFGLALYGTVAVVLTVVGALAELTGLHNLQTGHMTIGAWEVAVGAIVLYAGFNVVQDFVLPELRARRTE
jgi:hypothetical protein